MKLRKTRKKRLTESLHLMVEMTRKSNYNLNLKKLHINKITANHGFAANYHKVDKKNKNISLEPRVVIMLILP